jgi:hypothetical protein
MKRGVCGLGVILLAGGVAGILIFTMKRVEVPSPPVAGKVAQASDGMAVTTLTDPVQVFQKALWRQPASDDKILHAERREWSTPADGVRQWRWFLAVKPGPALRQWLATNPFFLSGTNSPAVLASASAWFPKATKEFIIQEKSDGRLMLMWSADGQMLYASDSGHGFAAPSSGPCGGG